MDKAGDTQTAFGVENQGVEPRVSYTRIDDINSFQARYGLEKEATIQNQQVFALYQGDTHSPGEKAVLGINSAGNPGSQQDDRRVRQVGHVSQPHQYLGRQLSD